MKKLNVVIGFIMFCLVTSQALELSTAEKNLEKAKDPKSKDIWTFGIGYAQLQDKNFEKSIEAFQKIDAPKSILADYIWFNLGKAYKETQKYKEAQSSFEKVLNYQPTSTLSTAAELELVRISMDQSNWHDALNRLKKLERKTKGSLDYQNVLLNLVEVSLHQKQNSEACRAAVVLYNKFPVVTNQLNWGQNLKNVNFSEISIKCSVTPRDMEKRFRKLIVEGETELARAEAEGLLKDFNDTQAIPKKEQLKYEYTLAQVSFAERKLYDTIKNLENAHQIDKPQFESMMLLAKAYSQTEDHLKASGAYQKAFEIAQSRKQAHMALFASAFLSYQVGDYDGATRKFEQLTEKATGKILWDSRWHTAWIRYLKRDFDGAIEEFDNLAKSRNFAKGPNLEKVTYWKAMSLLRLGAVEKARLSFSELVKRKSYSYYSAAATARLETLPKNPLPSNMNAGTSVGHAFSVNFNDVSNQDAVVLLNKARNPAEVTEDSKALEEKEGETEADVEIEDAETSETKATDISTFKDPRLVQRFEKAKALAELGLNDWARTELREIESRTRNRSYLMTLLEEYAKNGEYYRSSYIADTVFTYQREQGGIEGEPQLWQFAFPKAYLPIVERASKKYDVPDALILSIIRGESNFKELAHSPAGALGLMQLIPPTAKQLAKDMDVGEFKPALLLKAEYNILFGARYLKKLLKSMNSHLPLVAASYNAGPHKIQGWLKDFGSLDFDEFVEHIPYIETRNYVKKVLRNYFVYKKLYEKSENALSMLVQKPTVVVKGPRPLAENWDEL